jgi:hypothetical protein
VGLNEADCSVNGCHQRGVDWLARMVDGQQVTIWLCRPHWITMKAYRDARAPIGPRLGDSQLG